MRKTTRRLVLSCLSLSIVAAAAGTLAACDKASDAPSATPGAGGPTPAVAPAASKYALAADPKDAISVLDAIKAAPKASVVVVGRIKDVSKGFAAFTLTDASLEYCGQAGEDICPTPWDYCCIPEEKIASSTIAVAVKASGEVVALPSIPEVRNMDLVAVVGTLTKDKKDVVLEATGWYRRERPKVGPTVKFPE